MILLLGGLIVGFVLMIFKGYLPWRRRVLHQAILGSQITHTSKGPMEFTRTGAGPVLLQLHGGSSGYDQTLAISWDLDQSGFTILTPSRPSYLRTPLTTGTTPEQAADALASLLDASGIDRVGVLGTSAGGPTALQFALRHPKRVWGLVLQSAIMQQFAEPRRTIYTIIGKFLFSKSPGWLMDFIGWGADFVMRCCPSLLIRGFLNTSDTLNGKQARDRTAYILRRPEKIVFFRKLVASGMPPSIRQMGLANDLRQLNDLPDYPLKEIGCPTLVIHGRLDAVVPFAQAQFAVKHIPQAELFEIDNWGHLIWVSPEAEECRNRLIAFLTNHAKSGIY